MSAIIITLFFAAERSNSLTSRRSRDFELWAANFAMGALFIYWETSHLGGAELGVLERVESELKVSFLGILCAWHKRSIITKRGNLL
jgi:hypothetical protein